MMTNLLFKTVLEIHGNSIQLCLFLLLFVVLWNIDFVGFLFVKNSWKRLKTNAPFVLTNLPAQILMGASMAGYIRWSYNNKFGFLNWLHIIRYPLLACVVSFLFLDFGEYIYHVLMHKNGGCWRFHAVHHSDRQMDISTTLREHPGENLIRQCFTFLWIIISGPLMWMLIVRQSMQIVSTLFAHASWRLPERTDRLLGFLFITPNLHHVHHHFRKPYTNSNYGDVLSIWDRIFGTFRRLPSNQIFFGLDTMMYHETERFIALIKTPFTNMSDFTETEGLLSNKILLFDTEISKN